MSIEMTNKRLSAAKGKSSKGRKFCIPRNDHSRSHIAFFQLFAAPADVNCDGSFGDWSACSASCGAGTQTRIYTIITEAAGNGKPCPHDSNFVDEQACNTDDCRMLIGCVSFLVLYGLYAFVFFLHFLYFFFLKFAPPLQTGAVLRLSTAQPSVRSALIRIFIAQTSLPSISFVAMTRVAPHRSLVRFLLPCGHPCAQGGLLGRGGVPRYPFQKKWGVCIPYGCPRQAGSRKHPARAFGCKHFHPLFHKGSSCVYVFFFVPGCLCVCVCVCPFR